MNKKDKILVLGARGMVGSSIVRQLKKEGYTNILSPGSSELNLLDQRATIDFFSSRKPDYVIDAAAKVGGIVANNTFRADFIFENLSIQNNVFEASFKFDVKKLLFLGSSCIYPKSCLQPIQEEYLLTGPLEETNEPYAIAKIAGLKLAENFQRQYGKAFFSVMPTNLYGVNDNFHPQHGHVIPGIIAKMDEAIKNKDRVFEAWGTGSPRREFLYVDDLAEACVFLMKSEEQLPHWLNVGTGEDITIKELVHLIADVMGFKGDIIFNPDYPDGTPRKLLDVSKIHELGWRHKTTLQEGLHKTIEFFRNSQVRSLKPGIK